MTRKRGIILGVGVIAFVMVAFILGSTFMNQNNTIPTQQVQEQTSSKQPTVNSEGNRTFVVPQGTNVGGANDFQSNLQRMVNASEAKTKLVMFAFIAGAIVMITAGLGKGFIVFYEHKRKTYDTMKDDLRDAEEVAIKYEALLSRSKSDEEKEKYRKLLSMTNDRQLRLLKQIDKNDSKFVR